MKNLSNLLILSIALSSSVYANWSAPREVMSDAYWLVWNDAEQQRIDADIEANRKTNGRFEKLAIPAGATVKVEQLTHSFYFGAHAFNIGQLRTPELNKRFREYWGPFFNSGTVAFYWNQLEPTRGKPRYTATEKDSEAFWANCPQPTEEPHWRRPPTDPTIDFLNQRGVRVHGHPMVWAAKGTYPEWLVALATNDLYHTDAELYTSYTKRKQGFDANVLFCTLTAEELAQKMPSFTKALDKIYDDHIRELANRYGTRVQSWDIVNESCTDEFRYKLRRDLPICRSCHERPMPADYVYKSFATAASVLPKDVKMNINDYVLDGRYAKQIDDLKKRGARIDVIGVQRHMWTGVWRDAIGGGDLFSPHTERSTILPLGERAPIHVSEITVPAECEEEAVHPGLTQKQTAELRQAIVARNLYRLWFSLKPVEAITWWNSIDGCAYKGESGVSGFFRNDMSPKPVYFAINDLINNQWKTRLTVKAGDDGSVTFRGFRGRYKLSWESNGKTHHAEVELR